MTTSRSTTVGLLAVRRALPHRSRRTIGSWCFVDHIGPATVTEDHSVDVGPHPHIGLQTVTWLTDGEILHRDSLGTEQVVRAGELNLMTAGGGISHSEEATGRYRGPLHGVQLWVAQPDTTRDGPPAMEHLAELPTVGIGQGRATVMVGSLAGATSPARADTDHVGVDIALPPGRAAVAVETAHEHGLVVLDGTVDVRVVTDADTGPHDDRGPHPAGGDTGPRGVRPGMLAWVAPGAHELVLTTTGPTRLLLLGGTPWDRPPLMWWNFVARTHTEMSTARDDWEKGASRFGRVTSPLGRIAAPALPLRLHAPGGG